jgi:hypothetical protein
MKVGLKGGMWRARRAHTLAEVMVATLIVATMTVSLFAGFSAGFAIVLMAREDERATQILNSKVEAVRYCRWSDLTNYPVIPFLAYYDHSRNGDTNLGAVYVGTISNSDVSIGALAYASDMKLVTVSVQWTNHSGSRVIVRTRSIQTQVARYGMQNYLWGMTP